METIVKTNVKIGLVRFSYLHIWEPKSIDPNAVKKYSVSLLIDKADTVLVAKIKAAIDAAIEQGKSNAKFSKGWGVTKGKFHTPLRDGDTDRPEDPNYAGKFFVNASRTTKPQVVDRYREIIADPTKVYSGCYGYADVNFYPFDTAGNRGVGCGLNHIMKVKDGEPFSGSGDAKNAFADIELEDEDDLGL